MTRRTQIAIFGLSVSSSWGNGHATTYRALLDGLARLGCRIIFYEREAPWYKENRDLPAPGFCDLVCYDDIDAVLAGQAGLLTEAEAVIVGSYVPEGVRLIDRLAALPIRRLCFYDIDTPITLARLARGEEEYVARRQIPLFSACFSFSGGPVLTLLEQRFGARRAFPLYCAADPELYRPLDEPKRWDLGYLGTFSPDRQPALERLLLEPARRLPHLKFVVAGPQYPDTLDWPANVERITHLPPGEHARFYSRQRFTLNITRAAMAASGWSPSVRLFEAGAAGVPVLSDTWPGLGEFFPGGEAIVLVRDTAEVVDVLTGMEEAERAAIAARARGIVLSRHTGLVRAGELLRDLLALPERNMSRKARFTGELLAERPVT